MDLLKLVAVQASLALENSNLVSMLSTEIAERERKNAEKEAAERANKVKSGHEPASHERMGGNEGSER